MKPPRMLVVGVIALLVLGLAPGEGPRVEPRFARASEMPYAPTVRGTEVAPAPRLELERLAQLTARAEGDVAAGDAFGPTSWYVPPPPPPPPPVQAPVPPPPPTAPPLPFSYFGRYEEDGAKTILLLKGERMYTVAEGDVIEQTYRVERLANGQLELTYLPLNITQTLSTGEPS